MDSTGRDNKSNAKAKFGFSIQANVVVNGVMRMSIVPKHVTTGGNFGATHLIMALWSALKKGKLPKNKRKLLRHTDGGPDNVTKPTHVLHWLLVYIGVFEEIEWFRFDAGHSHTEIADRLFAMMKKLFESDSAARVEGVPDFVELEKKLQNVFSSCKEMLEVSYMLCNWDLDSWFGSLGIDPDGDFAGISFDNVFRYEYVGASHWKHGGVKVTYKDRLSTRATQREAEWKPIRTVESEHGNFNETTPEGVQYVRRPPDLRKEPMREDFSEKVDPAELCAKVVSVRDGTPFELPQTAKVHWNSLRELFAKNGDAQHAGAMPDLPVTIGPHTFDGCPRKLLPILQDLQRFPRPLITWDIFKEEPPAAFPQPSAAAAASASAASNSNADNDAGVQLRDPRVVNHVTHMAYTTAEQGRDQADLSAADWAKQLECPVDEVANHTLYIVELDEADGELALGLVESRVGANGKIDGLWFGRKSGTLSWGANPTFEHYNDSNGRIVDELDATSFLYAINDKDLTDASVATKFVQPRLSSAFMLKLRELAKLRKLRAEDMKKADGMDTLAELTTDTVRSKEWTITKLTAFINDQKLTLGLRKKKEDVLDLVLAYIIVIQSQDWSLLLSKLAPLPSMAFFEQQRKLLPNTPWKQYQIDRKKAADDISRKWMEMNTDAREPFVKLAAELSASTKGLRTKGNKRPRDDADAD